MIWLHCFKPGTQALVNNVRRARRIASLPVSSMCQPRLTLAAWTLAIHFASAYAMARELGEKRCRELYLRSRWFVAGSGDAR